MTANILNIVCGLVCVVIVCVNAAPSSKLRMYIIYIYMSNKVKQLIGSMDKLYGKNEQKNSLVQLNITTNATAFARLNNILAYFHIFFVTTLMYDVIYCKNC